MKDFIRRAIASSIAIPALVGLIAISWHPIFQYLVAAAVASLTAVAVWEYGQLAMAKGGRMFLPLLMVIAVIQVFSFFLAALQPQWAMMPLCIFFLSILTLFALHFHKNEGAVVDMAVSSFGLLYIAVPMGMMLSILYSGQQGEGRWWLGYLLVVTKISDIGAYFGGKLLGRRKLAPAISPGKTIEGAIFGLGSALLASFLFHLLEQLSSSVPFSIGVLSSMILGLVLGLVGQFGDLSESLLKRDANKKDSNNLPGLGGALDALDSLLFNTAIIYLYLKAFPL